MEIVDNTGTKHLKFWQDAEKNEPFELESPYTVGPTADRIVEFYVEGLEPTETFDSLSFSATYTVAGSAVSGEIKFGVTRADIDVDSDNSAGIKAVFTDEDDKIEFSRKSENLGKIMLENNGDVDSDGVADHFDGLGLENADSAGVSGLNLTPMSVTLEQPFDPTTAKIMFTYTANVPRLGAGIAKDGDVVDGIQPYKITNKGLRLWKVDGDARKNGEDVTKSGGHFIPPGEEIDWEDLVSDEESSGRRRRYIKGLGKPRIKL